MSEEKTPGSPDEKSPEYWAKVRKDRQDEADSRLSLPLLKKLVDKALEGKYLVFKRIGGFTRTTDADGAEVLEENVIGFRAMKVKAALGLNHGHEGTGFLYAGDCIDTDMDWTPIGRELMGTAGTDQLYDTFHLPEAAWQKLVEGLPADWDTPKEAPPVAA